MRKLTLKRGQEINKQLQDEQAMDERKRAVQRARENCRKELEKPEVRAVFERLADK
ncbi:hypothetical protein [Helicobacter suis]|uniref:hypothetical protein n=1 Tax=Helicobacter suis TaxID=104628 RepID=UPI0013D3A020|nr:hypothetical protein [Helicobacter suis]